MCYDEPPKPRVLISVGEASGDHHAALMLRAFHKLGGRADFSAMGGPKMAAEGVRLLADHRHISVIGIWEALRQYPRIRQTFKRIHNHLQNERPDLLLLVDYPNFNLRLAALAKAHNIPVLYYISPQIWAWHAKRIEQIRRDVDHMAVLFDFERDLYRKAGVPVSWVSHPLVDTCHQAPSREQAKKALNLPPQQRCIAFFPGSRESEIQQHMPIVRDSVAWLRQQRPDILPLLSEADTLPAGYLDKFAPSGVRLLRGQHQQLIRACDVSIAASGTITLEIALLGCPMLIFYRLHPISYQIGKWLVKTPFIGLPNIVAKRAIVPEYLQHEARGSTLAKDALRLLEEPERYQKMQKALQELQQHLPRGGDKRAAEVLLGMLQTGPQQTPGTQQPQQQTVAHHTA